MVNLLTPIFQEKTISKTKLDAAIVANCEAWHNHAFFNTIFPIVKEFIKKAYPDKSEFNGFYILYQHYLVRQNLSSQDVNWI